MPCPKCNGKLDWKDRMFTTGGEDPGHWRCVNCGKIIYPGQAQPSDFQDKAKMSTGPDPETEPAKSEGEEKNMHDPINCVICGKEFIPRRCDQKTCSKLCRDKYYRETKSWPSRGRKKIKAAPSQDSAEEAIFLERSILMSIEKKIALKLIEKFKKMVEETYA